MLDLVDARGEVGLQNLKGFVTVINAEANSSNQL